jgi:putative transposase
MIHAEPRRSKQQLPLRLATAREAHAGADVQLWFMDEARVGHKGRACHGWSERGERPPGLLDQRFAWAWLSAAGHPKRGEDVALVLASVSAGAMSVLLKPLGESLGSGVHAVLALDQAGWHGAKALKVPSTITLVPLPSCSPQLNPVERVWEYVRERFLSHRLHRDDDAVLEAACRAWNRLVADPGRLQSLCAYPWIQQLAS